MSIINCVEKECVYCKEGKCNLNTIKPNAGVHSAVCVYFNSKNIEVQNQKKS